MNNSIEFKSFLQVTELGTILATEIFKSVGSSLMAGKKVKVKSLSRVQLFATPWTVVYQAPPSMGFSRQEYWSGLPFSSLLFRDVLEFFSLKRYVLWSVVELREPSGSA